MIVDQQEKVRLLQRIHLFRDMEEAKLQQVTAFVESVELAPGEMIFQRGDYPDYFYIIYSGQVRILQAVEGQPQDKKLGLLEDGDYFGQELLDLTWLRQLTAIAETPVTLLRISAADFRKILEILPGLGPRLQLILDSYRLMLRARFNWLEDGEYIYYIARRHPFFMVVSLLLPLLLAIGLVPVALYVLLNSTTILTALLFLLVLIVCGGWLIWAYVDWTNDYFVVTTNRAVFQERVVLLYDSRQETPLDQVQSSSSNTSQIGRILGYGNVVIRSFFSTVLFRNVGNPGQVMFMLQDRQFHAQTYQRWKELEAVGDRLVTRFSKGPKMPNPPPPPKREVKPDPMQQFLSTFLNLRYEVAGAVVYRTHLFILIGKIFMPAILLIALFFLFLFNALGGFAIFPAGAACSLTFLVGMVLIAWLAYRYFDWHYDVYIISGEQIIDVNKKPLGHEERRAAPLDRIQNIEYKQLGIIALLLNYGTVFIQVGDQRFTFDDVHRPADVQRELFRRLSERKRKDAEKQAENDRQRLEDWIATYDAMKDRGQLSRTPPPKTRAGF